MGTINLYPTYTSVSHDLEECSEADSAVTVRLSNKADLRR